MTDTIATDELTPQERRALETLLVRLADDEFVIAERYTEWQVRAPSLESDLALANIAQDELGHARLWYDVLGDLGYDEPDLLYEREAADFRHGTLCELPFETGDWADPIVRSYLYDVAEAHRLEALSTSTHAKIANRVPKIVEEETYHRDHAEAWLDRLLEDDEGHERVQTAIDRLFPHAVTLFEPAVPPTFGAEASTVDPREIEETIVDSGLRSATLEELATAWFDDVSTTFDDHGLSLPVADVGELASTMPSVTGRSGEHTDDWFDLHAEFTHTYRELGRSDTTRIMPDPTDG